MSAANPTHANAQRYWLGGSVSQMTAAMDAMLAAGQLPIPVQNGAGTSGKTDQGTLDAVVGQWVSNYGSFAKYDAKMAINIANEWGPGGGTTWRDAYIGAVGKLRAAGYKCPLVIDAPAYGQGSGELVTGLAAIVAADPQHNVIGSIHIYGSFTQPATAGWQQDYATAIAAMKTCGAAVIVGEFGPGGNFGPSPTPILPLTIMRDACTSLCGFIAWSWDDPSAEYSNNQDGSASAPGSFALCKNTNGGDYTSSADLTFYGRIVVEDPTFGTLHSTLAKM